MPETPTSPSTIGVFGAGTMGHGIAYVCAMAGYQVHLYDIDDTRVHAGLARIEAAMDKGVARGKVAQADRDAALARITGHTEISTACAGAQLLIEAVPEDLQLKRTLLAMDRNARPDAIFATNTSSLSVALIAEAVTDSSRVIGTHFFNPVYIMKLLEVVTHGGTAPHVLETVLAFGERIGKTTIVVKDSPGFATSRLGVCLGMEAIRMLEEGVASAEDIDTAMVLGYRHPIGPLKLTDLVGLDVRMAIGQYLARELGNDAFKPPALMERMVAAGTLGQKTGQGFYPW